MKLECVMVKINAILILLKFKLKTHQLKTTQLNAMTIFVIQEILTKDIGK